jgi:uncharacterized protein YjbI with pentapeptide repeats
MGINSGLEPEGDYEAETFADETYTGLAAGGARFADCQLTRLVIEDAKFRRARFSDTRIAETRLVSADLSETGWTGVTFTGCVLAGVQAFSSVLRRVKFSGCKLDSVNLRDATLTDVLFEDCVMRDTDFGSEKLTRVRFGGSQLDGADFTKVTCKDVDLRGASLEIEAGFESLRGATIDSVQLISLAPYLARHLGLRVE